MLIAAMEVRGSGKIHTIVRIVPWHSSPSFNYLVFPVKESKAVTSRLPFVHNIKADIHRLHYTIHAFSATVITQEHRV
jgi:hypothetical protein